MDRGSYHCTGGGDQNHPQEEEMQQGKWLSEEALQLSEKRREAKDRRKGKIYLTEYRVPRKSKER